MNIQLAAMSSGPIEFHKVWIEQCEAAQDIRQAFSLQRALDYLIGEKLFSFVEAAEDDPDFAAELPVFVAEIRRMFSGAEVRQFLEELERDKFLAPNDTDLGMPDDSDQFEEEEPYLGHPVTGAEELLRFSRIRRLLTG